MRAAPYALFCASGAASLVYEVLWLRELAVLFGQTAAAAALTLAVFLAGLAFGAELGGRRRGTFGTYAALELAIALAAVASFSLLAAGRAAAPTALAVLGESFLGRLALAVVLVGPTAILAGATLPVMMRIVPPRRGALGRTGSVPYAANTAGAAAGAVVAGFVLVPALGVRGAYGAAITVNLAVAVAALALGRRASGAGRRDAEVAPAAGPSIAVGASRSDAARPSTDVVHRIAFVAGFAMLALEVLWTRMLAQVLHNSVHSFATVLATVLTALAVGAVLVRRSSRSRCSRRSWWRRASGPR